MPYKGLGQAWPDIGTGRVQLLVNTYPGSVPHLAAGRIRALLTGGARRSPQLPDVPTGVEAGLPAFESTAWHAVVAPAGTPRAIVAKLQQTLAATLGQPELGEMLNLDLGTIFFGPWRVIAAGGMVFFVVLAFNLLGDGLRDALDPKLKR